MRLKTCILVALTGSVLTAVPAAAQQAGEQDGSLRWTTTATNRQPATFNDVATGAGGTWVVGGDQKQDFQDSAARNAPSSTATPAESGKHSTRVWKVPSTATS